MDISKSIVLADKPAGPTSFEIVEEISRIYGVEKAGHAGTLDPKVTGVLLIALGEARKCMPILSGLDKEYEGEMLFHSDIRISDVQELAKQFTGKIKQVPPVRSAVARKERERMVHKFEILSMEGRIAKFRILCEAGTYIRKICHDMGEAAGTGAHMKGLRRTKTGPFGIEEAASIDAITKEPEKYLMRIEDALKRIEVPEVGIRPEFEGRVRNGQPVKTGWTYTTVKIPDNTDIFFTVNGGIIGIGKAMKNFFRIERVLN